MKKCILLFCLGIMILFSCGPKTYSDKSVLALKGTDGNGSVLQNVNNTMSYYLYLPPGYEEKTAAARQYPLLVTLHGSGQADTKFSSALFSTTCLPLFNGLFNPLTEYKTDKQKTLATMDPLLRQSVILIPQNRDANSWAIDDLYAVIKKIMQYYRVDQTRIYMTGVSMGGIGSWNFAVKYPDLLAAIIPVCGSHPVIKNGPVLRNLANWAFHAVNDDSVRFSESYMDFLSELTPDAKDDLSEWFQTRNSNKDYTASGTDSFESWRPGALSPTGLHTITVYASGGHTIWSRVYSTNGLWDWVYGQKKN